MNNSLYRSLFNEITGNDGLITLGSCGRLNKAPHPHKKILGTFDCIILYDESDFEDVMKLRISRPEDYLE